ncbi:MAG: shikimate kinase [Clostridiales bacterium]
MKNIILIGMPAVGKSTIGVVLAKILGYKFIDTDILIQEKTGKLLKNIIKDQGTMGFINIEEQVNSEIEAENAIIATGGSAIYSSKAMQHLGSIGTIIYLRLNFETLNARLKNIKNRGVIFQENESLSDLYAQRSALYEKYAHIIIDEDGCNVEDVIEKILLALGKTQ